MGDVSFTRKSKPLLGHWLVKIIDIVLAAWQSEGDALSTDDITIDRDVIVLLNVNIWRGDSAATIAWFFHVVDIFHEKYYI